MKKATITAGLAAAAAGRDLAEEIDKEQIKTAKETKSAKSKTVLIGGQFPPEVRRVLLLVQAEPENEGKTLRDLLGEAINDLCAKYRKPQPYTRED